jgi:formylmethanofuran dehydrogenase subunit E
LTGCTYGKGNLIHYDHGKNAFTFFRRSDGRAIRIVARPDAFGPPNDERQTLAARVRAGQGTAAERARFQVMQNERSDAILATPLEQLFSVSLVQEPPPRKARIHASLICARCGEATMETRVRQLGGQTLCLPCFEERQAEA